MTIVRVIILGSLILAGSARGDFEGGLREAGSASGPELAGTGQPGNAAKVYIVQLKAPAAVAFQAAPGPGGPSKIGAGGMAAPAAFDKHASGVQSYVQRLTNQHDEVLARAAPGSEKIYSYGYSLNGFAARMTPAQAVKLAGMPEVLHVWQDEIRPLATNFSPEFLGLFEPEVGLRGAEGLDGEGIVIGVIDSGITPEHPSLADTREADRPRACRSRWAEASLLGRWLCRRYDRLEDVLVFQPPENWNGTCQAGPDFTADACNNKMIGARYFFEGAAVGPIDSGEIFSARDVDGHGTHTATTAAGNRVRASIFGTFLGDIEGIAPKARVAAYKACWLRPGDLRATCNTSDLANAIDAAVADGVHIINYSVGSSRLTTTAPDDVALMAAAKAGVLTVVAAGNEGPDFDTIGSPAGGPWVITAGASSRDGEHSLEAMEVSAPASVAGRYAVREASFTPQLIDSGPVEGRLVLVDDDDETFDDGTAGTAFDACEPLVNGGDVSGNIAYIQRGGCAFEIKIDHAEDAGAIAALVFNIAGSPIVMNGVADGADIPALMVGQADGNLLLNEIDAGQAVEVVFDKGFFLTEEDTGNLMGTFSSRGPGPAQDILKPDVTAPGINILAGFTPDAANSVAGENFAFLTGTSMSTPHVAGVAALLRQSHTDWSPAAIKSALMTTAYQGVTKQDGETPANPFDFGSGHIDPNLANDPGLVYDVTADEYDAFACGTASPAVDQARCDELAIAGFSFEAVDLNQPSIALSGLSATQTVSRRVTNVDTAAGSYAAEIEAPPGISVLISPSTLSLAPGESASFEVTLAYESGELDLWRFGSLTWVGAEHAVRSVLAVRPRSISAPAEVRSVGSSGSLEFPVEFGYTGAYTPGVHGLGAPLVFDADIEEDPDRTFSGRTEAGVNAHSILIAENQLYARFAMFDEFTDGEDDLDMYVFYCADDPSNCIRIGESGEPTSDEQFNITLPPPGEYLVFVHGFDTDDAVGGPGANYLLLAWEFGLTEDMGNMTATAPGFVNAGSTENVTINWSGLAPNTIYLGGISHNTPEGLVALTVVTIDTLP